MQNISSCWTLCKLGSPYLARASFEHNLPRAKGNLMLYKKDGIDNVDFGSGRCVCKFARGLFICKAANGLRRLHALSYADARSKQIYMF